MMWPCGQRGFWIVGPLAVGDIIEFGITASDQHGQPVAGATDQWYGWLRRVTPLALVVVGPYRFPDLAARDAHAVIDEILLDQLAAPPLPFTDAEMIDLSHEP